jgi:hypothetical protein
MTFATTTRTELAERAHAIWSAIRSAAYALTDEQIDRPNSVGNWTGRDVMVHVANWEEIAIATIRSLDAGEVFGPVYSTNAELDAWNESHVAPYRTVPLAEARNYFEQTHRELLATIGASTNVYPRIVLGC